MFGAINVKSNAGGTVKDLSHLIVFEFGVVFLFIDFQCFSKSSAWNHTKASGLR